MASAVDVAVSVFVCWPKLLCVHARCNDVTPSCVAKILVFYHERSAIKVLECVHGCLQN
jgi:hypothetical protein